jgi:hypothetical protein
MSGFAPTGGGAPDLRPTQNGVEHGARQHRHPQQGDGPGQQDPELRCQFAQPSRCSWHVPTERAAHLGCSGTRAGYAAQKTR